MLTRRLSLLALACLVGTLVAVAAPAAPQWHRPAALYAKFPAAVRQLLEERQHPRTAAAATIAKRLPASPDSRFIRSMSSAASTWSSEYGSGIAPAQDADFDLALTPLGNVAVTGFSTGSATGADIVTTLYDPSGGRIWTARYDGAVHGDDAGVAVAVDDSGNVYVAGKTARPGTGWDIVVIKYEAGGTLAWTYFLDITGEDDAPVAIAMTAAGQLYVAGTVASAQTLQSYGSYNDNILLVKLSRNGALLWSKLYDGAEGKTDRVTAMALDNSGNVFLAGSTLGTAATDYVILKYSTGGSLVAEASYDGTGADDGATALAVDGSGFVYVTGWSSGSGTDEDFATVKFDNDLFQQWAVRYDGPASSFDGGAAIAVNDSGSVFVTGWSVGSGGSFDIMTLKYTGGGAQAWGSRFDGSAGDLDVPTALVLDAASNIEVAGSSYGSSTADDMLTLTYNVSGVLQSQKHYNGTGNAGDYATKLLLDPSGNIYVSGFSDGGSTGFDAALLKYSTSGTTDWADRYDGPGNSFDRPAAVAMDANGNIYVAGESDGVLTAADFLVVKYNAAGTFQWDTRLDGVSSSYDYVTAMAIDASGSVYLTGYSDGDYLTVKLNGDGQQLWGSRYDGPANSTDYATAIALDGAGSVLVTGRSYGSDGSYDIATIKYNAATGNAGWIARYAGPSAADDLAAALNTDGAGNVYVTGTTGSYPDNDYLTVRYTTAGAQKWAATYNGSGNSDDEAVALALQPNGRLVVTGRSFASATSYDIITLAYDTVTGSPVWSNTYNGAGDVSDDVRDLAVDGDGNVLLAGASGLGASSDMLILKLSAGGSQLWASTLGGSDEDAGTAVTVDGVGNVYAAGYAYRSADWSDLIWAKFAPNGTTAGANYYDSPNSASDAAVDALIDNVGNLVVAAQSGGIGSSWMTTVEFAQSLSPSQTASAAWNMVSLPLTVANPQKTAVYPTAISNAFSYSPSGYAAEDTILPRLGYWVKFGFAQTLSFSGEQRLVDTVALHSGWNLIGSIAYPLPTAAVVQVPPGIVVSPYYAYSSATSYTVEDTIAPFRAHWVKSNAAGSLLLDLRSPLQEPAQVVSNDGLNELTVLPAGTAAASGARLYFGRSLSRAADAERSLLPPPPPAGAFDARFATGHSMAIVADAGELPLAIQAGATLRWTIAEPDARYLLVERKRGTVVAEHAMTGSGQIALDAGASYAIREGTLPERYQLSQNFPNPFNPSTTIQYALPAKGFVRITIVNTLGQEVATLVNGIEEAGSKAVVWDAGTAPSGVYFCHLTAGGFTDQRKMLLVR